jgi:hypothetical protein
MTMRLPRLLPVLTLLALALALGKGEPGGAQGATPSGEGTGAIRCEEIEPRDLAALRALSGTPQAGRTQGAQQTSSTASPTPFAMPDGQPADEATLTEIETLYLHLVTCLNAGDYLRVYALYTDDYLTRNLSEETLVQLGATPIPVEESTQSEFGGVREARLLDDNRIAALLRVSNPQTGDVVIYSILQRDGDRLRIDEESVVEAEIPGTPISATGATPAA